jgi:membrane fusion protein (multidrug efflux system)
MKHLIVLLSVVLAACSDSGARQQEKKAAKDAAPAAVPVAVQQAAAREVPVTFEAVARTEGSREVQVRARVAGILEKQLYNEGERVREGQPLFRIERAPFEIELAQARAALVQESAKRDLAQQDYERLKGLADKRAISQKEADQAASAREQSGAAVLSARARVRQAELNLSYTEVKAPIEGVTGRALQSVGTLVSPNAESALLTTMTRADPIWVRFALSESEYARLRGSEEIQVHIELADGKAYPHAGKLNFAGSTVDAATGTVQMRAELPNPKDALLPGQYVRVRVQAGTQQAFVVPQTAVAQNETGRFVWVVADGKAVQRQVRTGNWLGPDWVILDGLKPGDQVIVDNLVRLRPGAAVAVK